MQTKKQLTFFEAASIVTGFGIGGGIMAVPYLASLTGILPFIITLIISFFFSVIIHLMIAEMAMRDSSSSQLVESFGKFLFRGRGAIFFTWFFFVMIVFAFLANLSAYIAGGGEILRDLISVPLWSGHFLTYIIAAGVVFFGLKAIGISEKYSVIGIFILVGILAVASLRLPFSMSLVSRGGTNEILALYGMIMFSFAAFFSIPQVVEGLDWNKPLVPKAIILGISMNLVVVVIVTVFAAGISKEVTRVAITGWGKALGDWAFIFGSLFILLAMLTSYWSISFALAVILKERMNWGEKLSWFAATLPTFLIVITGISDFLGFMRLAGGAIALLVAIMVVPVLRAARKYGDVKDPEWKLGIFGNGFFQVLIIIAFLVMAVASMLKID